MTSRTALYGFLAALSLLVSGMVVAPQAAFAASATYPTTPTANEVVHTDSVTISGRFTSDADVKQVRITVCVPTGTTCGTYLQAPSSGALGSVWVSMPAALTFDAGSTLSGTYSLTVSNLPNNTYRVGAYVVDAVTKTGPRSTTDFTVEATPVSPQNPSPGYVTVLWGRSNWQVAWGSGCTTTAGALTLEDAAKELAAHKLFGVGGVVINRTQETQRTCFGNYVTQPSWDDLARLRDVYGWRFVSQGMGYSNMTLMQTDEERYAESVATLPVLESHGHTRAWGAFNYPNNKQDAAAQAVVTKAFAFGRKYGKGTNTKASVSAYPYVMSTASVNGGRCTNPALPCSTMKVANNRVTTTVPSLASLLSPKDSSQWNVVQFYRLVEGRQGAMGDAYAWDCSSPSWTDRWTSQPEIYCVESLREVLNSRTTTSVAVDPATMAETWGVLPSGR